MVVPTLGPVSGSETVNYILSRGLLVPVAGVAVSQLRDTFDEGRPVAVVADDAAVEDLLDEDRHRQLAGGGEDGEDRREHEALPQLRGDGEAPPEHLHRAGAGERVFFGGRLPMRPLVVAAPRRRRRGDHLDRGVVVVETGRLGGHATSSAS